MKEILITQNVNPTFDTIVKHVRNAYETINYEDKDNFFDQEDVEYVSIRLKQVLKRLNKLSK